MNVSAPYSPVHTLKRELLRTLYEIYDDFAQDFTTACTRRCNTCCTHNVLATSLEVDLVLEFIELGRRDDLQERVSGGSPGRRMRPGLSINALAECCLKRQEPPDCHEEYDSAPCPLREPDGCPVYPVRPFACRSLWSMTRCEADGAAVMQPRLITVNGMFEQIIEHVDTGGLCGNMLDLREFFADGEMRSAYHAGIALRGSRILIRSRPNPGFLIPDEHKTHAARILDLMRDRVVAGRPFFEALYIVRTQQPAGPRQGPDLA
jgi:hypothetical protein